MMLHQRWQSVASTLVLLSHPLSAFTIHPSTTTRLSPFSQLYSSTVDATVTDAATTVSSVEIAKKILLQTAERLKRDYGTFLLDMTAKEEFSKAVQDLEVASTLPSSDMILEQLRGDWTLICTTSTSDKGIDTDRLLPPFFKQEGSPLKELRDSLRAAANKYWTIQQRFRSSDETDPIGTLDRVDHILEYMPPKELRDIVSAGTSTSLPEQLAKLNINPFQVSDSKLTLVHKAKVDTSVSPVRTKLTLTGIVLNVAGKSTFLDPNGKDVLGINLPQVGDIINTGDFETTFMDDTIRISRGKQGLVDQLRVFVRTDKLKKDAALDSILQSNVSVGQGVASEQDVDEAIDPEFTDEDGDAPSDVENTD